MFICCSFYTLPNHVKMILITVKEVIEKMALSTQVQDTYKDTLSRHHIHPPKTKQKKIHVRLNFVHKSILSSTMYYDLERQNWELTLSISCLNPAKMYSTTCVNMFPFSNQYHLFLMGNSLLFLSS